MLSQFLQNDRRNQCLYWVTTVYEVITEIEGISHKARNATSEVENLISQDMLSRL